MSNQFTPGSFPALWITSSEPLPNTCITCGMFTDNKVKSKFVYHYQKTVAAGDSGDKMALGCLLHLLGPLGLILAAASSRGGDKNQTTEKTVTKKSSIKVPCCKLCAGQQVPEAVQSDASASRFMFEAHPRFAERLDSLRSEQMS